MTSKLRDTPDYSEIENKTILDLIDIQAKALPKKLAIKHNETRISYEEIGLFSDHIANFFLKNSFKVQEVIAVSMDRSAEMSLCLLGILKTGAIYLPIDPALPLERVQFLMKDASARVLVISKKYEELYQDFNTIIFDEIWSGRTEDTLHLTRPVQNENHLAYIIYTSGSTGMPKGVGITQKSLLNLLQYRLHSPGVDSSDNMLGITTMSFDISEEELYLPLICGAQLTIVDNDIAKDGQALLETIKSEKITIMQATPYVWQMMLEVGWEDILPIKAFCGGEALTKKLANTLMNRCKELWNMYGPTETTICSIAKKLDKSDEIITIGKPIDNTQVYILDDEMNKVAPGAEGELYISGAGVSPGYINRPELTAQKFLDDIFSDVPGQKMYKTGDLATLNKDGDIQFLGRIDTQVKVRGYRIETEEIEYHLKEHQEIKDAVVVVHQDLRGNARLIAYFTVKHPLLVILDADLVNTLKNSLKKTLPEYMVPADYLLITAIPLLPSGKIDKKALPAPEFKNSGVEYTGPSTELEKIITEIWTNTIGIKKIGVNDNFFDLGGTSLVAVKTKIQIEKVTNKRLRPSVLFKYPTIKELAQAISESTIENFKSLVPIKPDGSKIPIYIVHGIGLNVLNFRGLAMNMDADQPVYGLQAIDSDDPIDPLFTIEDMAAFYNNEIMSHNPNGPYVIAGYSIGGVIAFEMVKQLKEQGKKVSMLVMFDSSIQIPSHQYHLLKKIYAKSLRQVFKLKFRISSFSKYPKENMKYLKEVYTMKFRRYIFNEVDNYGLPDYMTKTIMKITNAFYKYKIVPIDVQIDLFVTQKVYYLDDPKYLGWKKFAKQGIKTYNISSGHNDMFESRYIKEIADLLQKRLNEINN